MKKAQKNIEVTYEEAQEGKPFCQIKNDTIPKEVIPSSPKGIEDWDPTALPVLLDLANRICRIALPALVDFFEFDQQIGGIRATDLFSLNSLMGATIEDQVVSTLNRHRETWDDGQWSEYTFQRSAQAFPDVRLVHRSDPEDIKIGIELKSWFLLSKEGVPSMRFVPHPSACAPLDMVCVIPWYLSNAVCGVPMVAVPWIQQAKFATEWSMYFWKYLRQTDRPQSLEERSFREIGTCTPYPKKSDSISLHPQNDSGGNYGRLPRYHPIMDEFCTHALQTQILGIPAEDWRYFLQIHTEAATIDEIKKRISSRFGGDDLQNTSKIFEIVSNMAEQLPGILIR